MLTHLAWPSGCAQPDVESLAVHRAALVGMAPQRGHATGCGYLRIPCKHAYKDEPPHMARKAGARLGSA